MKKKSYNIILYFSLYIVAILKKSYGDKRKFRIWFLVIDLVWLPLLLLFISWNRIIFGELNFFIGFGSGLVSIIKIIITEQNECDSMSNIWFFERYFFFFGLPLNDFGGSSLSSTIMLTRKITVSGLNY